MADKRDASGNLLSKIKRWLGDGIVQDVPPDVAACEFQCRVLECNQGQWETCPNRLQGAGSDGQK